MNNYLELKVPIRWDAVWFVNLRKAMEAKDIDVRWQKGHYHITVAFLKDDQQVDVDALTAAFGKILSQYPTPKLTLDTVDAFQASDSPMIIVNLTSSQPSPELLSLVAALRQEVQNSGVPLDTPFRLHITLGRISTTRATLPQVQQNAQSTLPQVQQNAQSTLPQVQQITRTIPVPTFTLPLQEARYLYQQNHTPIESWTMKKN